MAKSHFHPTEMIECNNYTFTLGDKINFYWKDGKSKQWRAFSDTNPYYAAYMECNKELMLAFVNVQKDRHTTGIHIGRLCPLQQIISRGTLKHTDGNWYTSVTIKCGAFFNYHKIGYIIKPQSTRPVR